MVYIRIVRERWDSVKIETLHVIEEDFLILRRSGFSNMSLVPQRKEESFFLTTTLTGGKTSLHNISYHINVFHTFYFNVRVSSICLG